MNIIEFIEIHSKLMKFIKKTLKIPKKNGHDVDNEFVMYHTEVSALVLCPA